MPSILLSDNGVSSGSAGLKSTAASDGALALQTTTAGGTATTAVTIDTSQNVGVGVTPSAWSGLGGKAIELLGGSFLSQNTSGINIAQNAYINAGNWTYKNNNYAEMYAQGSGQHQWFTAPSGTGGNSISFTQAMTLDASGRLGIGVTSPTAPLTIASANTAAAVHIRGRSSDGYGDLIFYSDTGGTQYGFVEGGTTGLNLSGVGARSVLFGTNGAERARIDSSGNLLVGLTSSQGGIVQSQSTVAGTQCYLSWNSATSGTRYFHYFVTGAGATAVGSITTDGTTTTYATSSDYRLKEVSGSLTGYKERLSALQPKQGTWKENGAEFRGFLAHEFATSYPSSVNGEKDAVDENGNPKYQGMQAGSSEVIADLVALLQEQQAIIEQLKARLDAANL